ncbi:MAG TPA: hypothetical protein VJ650_13635 [Gemmatimonadaceae bacterium]|nr:hypothetical protein [Gemmatimonadaceae bacterium]
MRRIAHALAIALAMTSVAGAQADSVSQWPVGSRVRIRTTKESVVGQLTELRGDTLVIRKEDALFRPWKRIHVDSALALAVSRGRYISGERVAGGALGGAAAMVLTYVLMDAVIPDMCTGDGCDDSGPGYVQAALLGGAVGALGAVVIPADRWEEVPKPLRVSLVPWREHTRLVLSFSFR